MEQKKEKLDYCRIKKIFEKGFGFLTSLYYEENVFFHFSKIKNIEKREALSKLKRGVVSVYYTSELANGKRRVAKVWLSITEVPHNLIDDFIERLLLELNDGKTNPFEIIDALNQLRGIGKLSEQNYLDIITSKKIQKNPSILLKLISNEDNETAEKLESQLNKIKDDDISITEIKKELSRLLAK